MHLPNLLVITEAIMDLHQQIDSIKTIASAVVVSDPAKVAYAFQQITKEIIISKFLISVMFICHRAGQHYFVSQAFQSFVPAKYMLNKNSLTVKKCEANQKPQWL